ncbi:hypothetical protein D3OALGB2SA_1215 [Olavius algarvensis associated proteobacterium Delta 3]|nr:hypothetical protein D3OALGB2SA_1215 [Olavius algarvensis associated proteobacterium Delta 3]
MTLDGVSSSLRNLLEMKYLEKYGGLDGFSFRVFTTEDFKPKTVNHVSLFLYRIDVDASRRHYEYSPTEDTAASVALGLHLHYILTVWSGNAIGEHLMLSRCIEILDEFAIISGSLLAENAIWRDTDAIRICMESMTNEDMLRLWDSFEPAYHLSIPYLIRPVRLTAIEKHETPYVETYTNIYVPGASI